MIRFSFWFRYFILKEHVGAFDWRIVLLQSRHHVASVSFVLPVKNLSWGGMSSSHIRPGVTVTLTSRDGVNQLCSNSSQPAETSVDESSREPDSNHFTAHSVSPEIFSCQRRSDFLTLNRFCEMIQTRWVFLLQMLEDFQCPSGVQTKVLPLLYMSSTYGSAKTCRVHPPGLLNQKHDSIIKWHLTYSRGARSSQRRCGGHSGVFAGTLMDDVSQHNLGRHPALRVNDLRISICGRYRHGHVHRRLHVHEGLKCQCEAVKWSEGKFLRLCPSNPLRGSVRGMFFCIELRMIM